MSCVLNDEVMIGAYRSQLATEKEEDRLSISYSHPGMIPPRLLFQSLLVTVSTTAAQRLVFREVIIL